MRNMCSQEIESLLRKEGDLTPKEMIRITTPLHLIPPQLQELSQGNEEPETIKIE